MSVKLILFICVLENFLLVCVFEIDFVCLFESDFVCVFENVFVCTFEVDFVFLCD